MNEYEITVGIFSDRHTYTDCETYQVLASNLLDAAKAAGECKFREASYRQTAKREIIRIRRVA